MLVAKPTEIKIANAVASDKKSTPWRPYRRCNKNGAREGKRIEGLPIHFGWLAADVTA